MGTIANADHRPRPERLSICWCPLATRRDRPIRTVRRPCRQGAVLVLRPRIRAGDERGTQGASSIVWHRGTFVQAGPPWLCTCYAARMAVVTLRRALIATLLATTAGCNESHKKKDSVETIPEVLVAPEASGPRGTLTVRFPNQLEGTYANVTWVVDDSQRIAPLTCFPIRVRIPIGIRVNVWGGGKTGYIPYSKYIKLTPDAPEREISIEVREERPPGLFGLAKSELRKDTGLKLRMPTADELTSLDRAWDASERRVNSQIAVHEDSEDPARAAAAARLRAALLSGAGSAQTVLSWEQEVDFGRKQVELASQAPLSDDVALLELQPFIDDISEKTEALSNVLRQEGSSSAPRSNRIREALVGCRQSFNRVHDDLLWHQEHVPSGPAVGDGESLA